MFGEIFVLIWLMLELLPRDAGEREGWLGVRWSLVTCYWYQLQLQLSTRNASPVPPSGLTLKSINYKRKTVSDLSTCPTRPGPAHQRVLILNPSNSLVHFHQENIIGAENSRILLEAPALHRSVLSGWLVVVYILIVGHWTRAWWSHYTWMVTIRVD